MSNLNTPLSFIAFVLLWYIVTPIIWKRDKAVMWKGEFKPSKALAVVYGAFIAADAAFGGWLLWHFVFSAPR